MLIFALTDARARVSSDLPRRNINVIDILLRASIKEKHRGRMKYAAFRGARLSSSSYPRNTFDAMRGKRSGLNVAARPRGGSRQNKMEKREIRPRKFNGAGEGGICGVTRPPRGANPTVQARTSAPPRSEGYGATTFGSGGR